MVKKSAGVLMYRLCNNYLEVFLVHPGGPFYAKKDLGAWTIPKGEFEHEDPIEAAKREFFEETGLKLDEGLNYLKEVSQKSGKKVFCWYIEKDFNPMDLKSNTFTLEWPPRSGVKKEFPEIDKGDWYNIRDAKLKILEYQLPLLDELLKVLNLPEDMIAPPNSNTSDNCQENQLNLF